MIVIKKNRKEKGIRELVVGLNPHSKGDIFSKFNLIFFDIIIEIFIIIDEIMVMIKIEIIILMIIYI